MLMFIIATTDLIRFPLPYTERVRIQRREFLPHEMRSKFVSEGRILRGTLCDLVTSP
jgi:hypothetical protein